jgi:hypothetical protein
MFGPVLSADAAERRIPLAPVSTGVGIRAATRAPTKPEPSFSNGEFELYAYR